MLNFESSKGVRFCDGLTRRDFLKVGSLGAGAVGLSLADLGLLNAAEKSKDINCILLFLVGGPSQLDTWDPKPDAPDEIRGPFRPIKTNVPGVEICEHFPLMAKQADRYAILRSVHHKAAPIHETGHQMMQTGYLFRGGREYPHYGSTLSYLRRSEGRRPAAVRRDAGADRQHRRHGQPRPDGWLPRRPPTAVCPPRRPRPPPVVPRIARRRGRGPPGL